MCFSARVLQDLQSLSRLLGLPVDWETFKALFRQRLEGSGAKVSRALEANFDDPQSADAREIKSYIDQYRAAQTTVWEQALFKQKKRLVNRTAANVPRGRTFCADLGQSLAIGGVRSGAGDQHQRD